MNCWGVYTAPLENGDIVRIHAPGHTRHGELHVVIRGGVGFNGQWVALEGVRWPWPRRCMLRIRRQGSAATEGK